MPRIDDSTLRLAAEVAAEAEAFRQHCRRLLEPLLAAKDLEDIEGDFATHAWRCRQLHERLRDCFRSLGRSQLMKKSSVLQAAFGLISAEEAEAVYEALGQFVENAEEQVELEAEEGLETALAGQVRAAKGLLDRMDEALAALAG